MKEKEYEVEDVVDLKEAFDTFEDARTIVDNLVENIDRFYYSLDVLDDKEYRDLKASLTTLQDDMCSIDISLEEIYEDKNSRLNLEGND